MNSEGFRIVARVDKQFKERVKNAVDVTGIDEATLVRKSVSAIVDYIEENGGVIFPIKVVPNPAKKAKKSD